MKSPTGMARHLVLGLGLAATMAGTGITAGVDARSYSPLDVTIILDPVVREDDCGQQYLAQGTCAPRPDPNP